MPLKPKLQDPLGLHFADFSMFKNHQEQWWKQTARFQLQRFWFCISAVEARSLCFKQVSRGCWQSGSRGHIWSKPAKLPSLPLTGWFSGFPETSSGYKFSLCFLLLSLNSSGQEASRVSTWSSLSSFTPLVKTSSLRPSVESTHWWLHGNLATPLLCLKSNLKNMSKSKL